MAAIEVRATHPVPEEKAQALGVPWVEIDVEDYEVGHAGWNCDQSLPVKRGSDLQCANCQPSDARTAVPKAGLDDETCRRLHAELQVDFENGMVVRRMRLLDIMHPRGRAFREALILAEERAKPSSPHLLRTLKGGSVLARWNARADSDARLRGGLNRYRQSLPLAQLDFLMEWFDLDAVTRTCAGVRALVRLGLDPWWKEQVRLGSGALKAPGIVPGRLCHLHVALFLRSLNLWDRLPRRWEFEDGSWMAMARPNWHRVVPCAA